MTLTCHPTPSMCWQLWASCNKIKKTAPNHHSRLIRLQSQRPQWTWARLKVGRHHILLQTTIFSIRLKKSLDGSTGTFLLTRHLTQMNPDEYLPLRAHPPHRRLHRDKREDLAWGCLLLRKGECRSTSARHAKKPFHKKDTLMLRQKLKL